MAPLKVPIALFGVGKVGQGVLENLRKNVALHLKRYNVQFELCLALDRSGAIIRPSDVSPLSFLSEILQWKASSNSFSQHTVMKPVSHDAVDIPPNAILVDCSDSAANGLTILKHLKSGGKAVLANKKPLSGPLSLFRDLTDPQHASRFRFESTCGAGTPFIATVQRLLSGGDEISSMSGCFSGTLGFITTQLDDRSRMSQLLSSAVGQGYTEPDPRDDLSGADVARKALILARLCGATLEMSDVQIEPLFPPELASCSVAEFLARYGAVCDSKYMALVQEAKRKGCVLRYVASIQGGRARVGLKEVGPYVSCVIFRNILF